MPDKWVNYARTARPTRNGEAPLLAAYPRRWVVATSVLLFGAIGWVAGGLPLRIVVDDGYAIAHMELLGEYPNDIKSIELTQTAPSQVIWRIVAKKDRVQLHSIRLAVGRNTADLQANWGQATTQVPTGASEFVLMLDTPYQLRVCPSSWWRRCASEAFQFSADEDTQQTAAGDAQSRAPEQ